MNRPLESQVIRYILLGPYALLDSWHMWEFNLTYLLPVKNALWNKRGKK